MPLSRKYYVMIAKTIKEAPINEVDRELLADRLGAEFKADNPRFDHARFRQATLTKRMKA